MSRTLECLVNMAQREAPCRWARFMPGQVTQVKKADESPMKCGPSALTKRGRLCDLVDTGTA